MEKEKVGKKIFNVKKNDSNTKGSEASNKKKIKSDDTQSSTHQVQKSNERNSKATTFRNL